MKSSVVFNNLKRLMKMRRKTMSENGNMVFVGR